MNFNTGGAGFPHGTVDPNSNLQPAHPGGSGILAQGNAYQPTTNLLLPSLTARTTGRRNSLTQGSPLPLLDIPGQSLTGQHAPPLRSPMFGQDLRAAVPVDVRYKSEAAQLSSSNSATTSALLSLLKAQINLPSPHLPSPMGTPSLSGSSWETSSQGSSSTLSRAASSMSFNRAGSIQGLTRDGSTASLCSGWNQSLNLGPTSGTSSAVLPSSPERGRGEDGHALGHRGSVGGQAAGRMESFLPSTFGAHDPERVFAQNIAHPISQGVDGGLTASANNPPPAAHISWTGSLNQQQQQQQQHPGSRVMPSKMWQSSKSIDSQSSSGPLLEKEEKLREGAGERRGSVSGGGRRQSLTEQAESVRQRLPLDGGADAKADIFSGASRSSMGSFALNSSELEVSTNALRRVRKRARCIVKHDWVPRDAKRKTKGTLLLRAQQQARAAADGAEIEDEGEEAEELELEAEGGEA